MENIIAQLLVEMQAEILRKIKEGGLYNIGETAEILFATLCKYACELLQAILEETDAQIARARAERKVSGLKVKQRNVRRVLTTSIGAIEYHRTYYETPDGERIYLLDHLIGVESYERVSKSLCAKLVNLAAEMSCDKAVKHGNAPVSRQTVNNKIHGLREVVADVKRAEQTPEELHIFADEDHVHLKNGKNTMVPLATLTEGIDESNPKRHKLIEPLHIAGYGMDADVFNDQVEACVNEKYDINAIKHIYIHGDGASRIISLGERFPNACHVLDEFHLEKYLKKLGHFEGASQRICALRTALKDGNWKTYRKLLGDIYALQEEKDKGHCREIIRYLWNNRKAAHRRYALNLCGSCTEAMVSHVLSERLSRSPLAWSEEGLSQMSMLVVYHKNGQVVTSKDIRVSATADERTKENPFVRKGWNKYNNYMTRQIDSILSTDWADAFQTHPVSFGKVDASYLIRKSFGTIRGVA